MPIVSSFAGASSRAYGLSAGGAAPVGFNSIASTTLTGNQSTITFNNIPQTYKHLQLRVFSRVTSGYDSYLYLTMNGVAGTISHYLLGINNQGLSGSLANNIYGPVAYGPSGGQSASIFGVGILDILDYTNTNKFKTTRTLTGIDITGLGSSVSLWGGYVASTSAVTDIVLTTAGTNFAQYSSFALYGIEG
jgi:hypothetical protein